MSVDIIYHQLVNRESWQSMRNVKCKPYHTLLTLTSAIKHMASYI